MSNSWLIAINRSVNKVITLLNLVKQPNCLDSLQIESTGILSIQDQPVLALLVCRRYAKRSYVYGRKYTGTRTLQIIWKWNGNWCLQKQTNDEISMYNPWKTLTLWTKLILQSRPSPSYLKSRSALIQRHDREQEVTKINST